MQKQASMASGGPRPRQRAALGSLSLQNSESVPTRLSLYHGGERSMGFWASFLLSFLKQMSLKEKLEFLTSVLSSMWYPGKHSTGRKKPG